MVCLTELLLTCSQPYVDTASVNLNYTTYEGLRWPNGVNAFLGVRYAAPPVGHLRWRAPVEPMRTETGTVESAKTVSVPHVY
jgi:carboxylesterase type B